MDGPPAGSYAPRSPNLQALQEYTQSPASYNLPPASFHKHSPYQPPNAFQPQYPSHLHPQQPQHDPYHPFSQQQQQQQQQAYIPPAPPAFQQQHSNPMNVKFEPNTWPTPSLSHHNSTLSDSSSPSNARPTPARRGSSKSALKHESSINTASSSNPNSTALLIQPDEQNLPAPGDAEGVLVKTKFPVARIKRIVQADEDVGKVAQVTPVVVSKALELFMISLTLKSAQLARDKGSKRVTGQHLKAIVMSDDQFDFLREHVEKIPDEPKASERKGSSGAMKDDEDDDEDFGAVEEPEVTAPKKRRSRAAKGEDAGGVGSRTRRRRKKDSDEDF